MIQLLSPSCNQSYIPVIFITIMADGRDSADYNRGNSADANRDDANN